MDPRLALTGLASLSRGAADGFRLSHEPTHHFPCRLSLPGIGITDGQTRWGALGLGDTEDEAIDHLHAELTRLPEGQWVEAVQFDQGRPGLGRSDWPARRVAWDGERWRYEDSLDS